jgi:hypothetical protein
MAEIALLLGGTAIQAGAKIMQGREQARAAAFESEQLRIKEQAEKTAAAQDETRRRNELTNSLETIQAIRAGRGVGSGSPTGMAIFDSLTSDVERDIAISGSNYATRADLARRSALLSDRKARTSLLAGFADAGATLASGATKAATGRYT